VFGNTPEKRRQWWLDRLHLLNGHWHLVDLDEQKFPGTDANFRSWAYQIAERAGIKVKVTRSQAGMRTFGVQGQYQSPGEWPLKIVWLGPERAVDASLVAPCTCGSEPHKPSCAVWG
jgi:hypothetical protein